MTATVTSKGQITLPVETRRRMGIHAGTKLEFIIRGDDRLEVVKVGGSIRTLKGALPRPARTLTLQEMEAAIGQGALS